MKHVWMVLSVTLLLWGCSQTADKPATGSNAGSGVKLIEEVPTEDGEIRISYSKYRLDNGLTVVLHEDKSDPLVHVDVTYHVGSAREEPRRSGFAHFFEHMMFQGSEHVADDEHFKIITQAGGRMNGTTNNDRTNYYETIPSNYLETALWLESDRMGFLLDAVTQEKFEVQRSTVKNERQQNYENRPYGLFSQINSAALYPPDHPYAWPVIGYPEDLNAATLGDLKRFFLRWYGPNNATLSIGGNIDKQRTLELVKKYFGPIPAGPEVEDMPRQPVSIDRDRYVSYVDSNIRFPALLFTYPTVSFQHEDQVALQCLASIIGQGRKSYLYKQFVLSQKAIEASAFDNSMELAGSLTFFVLPYPGISLSEFEQEMRQLFANFDASSISEEDIQIFKASREASLIRGLASVQGKMSRLAYYQTFYDNPDRIREDLKALRSLTKEDVLRVFNKYVKDKPAVVQSVVPESNPDGQAQPDNYELPKRPPRPEDSELADVEPRPVEETFDRSKQPEPGQAPLVKVPEFWRSELAGGIETIGTYTNEVPLVTLQLSFEGGHLLDGPNRQGLASLTAAMMNEDTENYSAEEFEKELQKLGSRISVSASREETTVYMSSLRDQLEPTLALLEERLFRSRFTQEDLERLRQQQIESIKANKKQPSSIASNAYRKLLYGPDHPLSVPTIGNKESLQQITLEDVRQFSRDNLSADALRVVVVGEVQESVMTDKLGFLGRLPNKRVSRPELPPAPEVEKTKLYLVDKPGAAQSEIRIGYMTDLTYDATGEYFKRYLMNFVLGGAFNSRINMNLREDKGYTYGARSSFRGTELPGPFTASASVKKASTADSIRQFMKEIGQYRQNGISQDELNFMRSAVGQSEALEYETPRQKAGFLKRIVEYDLPPDFVETQEQIIDTITQSEINQLAKEYLPTERMYILVVGDKSAIHDSLKELDYPLVEINTEGQPVNNTSQ